VVYVRDDERLAKLAKVDREQAAQFMVERILAPAPSSWLSVVHSVYDAVC